MKMQLSVLDRLIFSSLLPKSGGMMEMELVAVVKSKVAFTAKEHTKFELKDLQNGSVSWNPKAPEVEFDFEESEVKLLKKGVEMNDKAESINEQNLELAKKIMKL